MGHSFDAGQQAINDRAIERLRDGTPQGFVRDEYYNEMQRYRSEQRLAEAQRPVTLPDTEDVRVDQPSCYPIVISFSTPARGTRLEMQRQLALQQTALNAKNPCQAAQDITNYPNAKPIGEAARPIARQNYVRSNASLLRTLNPSLTHAQALSMAQQNAAGKDAIHTLDMVAGGNPTGFSGLGGRSENRSIGSQWGPGGRAGVLEAYAINQCQNGCPTMQTELVVI